MIETIEGIVLSRVRYSDSGNVVSVFTQRYGRIAFVLSAGKGKRSYARNACIMPLACVNITLHYRSNVDLQRVSSIELSGVHHSLYSDIKKQTICLFLAEFLGKLLRTQPADEHLWVYLRNAVQFLDLAQRGVANFHIAMLAGLTFFLGVQPDVSDYAPNSVFDLFEGKYRTALPLHNHWIDGEQVGIPVLLSRLNFANMHCLKLSHRQRSDLLDGILKYYDLHFPGVGSLKSLDVLRCL